MAKLVRTAVKPKKKSDINLFSLIMNSIAEGNYVFTKHAKERSDQRAILESTVLDILEGRGGRKRRRNKSKDQYELHAPDWNYCIEGVDVDQKKIRVIVTFEDEIMPIITVMWI